MQSNILAISLERLIGFGFFGYSVLSLTSRSTPTLNSSAISGGLAQALAALSGVQGYNLVTEYKECETDVSR